MQQGLWKVFEGKDKLLDSMFDRDKELLVKGHSTILLFGRQGA